MGLVNLFYSVKPSMNYVFKDGSMAHFVGGRYFTKDEAKTKELDAEIAAMNPFLFRKQEELQVEQEMLDPVAKLRATLRAELLAEMLAGPQELDLGVTEKPESGAASSVEVTGGSSPVKITPKVKQ